MSYHRNEIKILPVNLAFGSLSGQWERYQTEEKSVIMMASVMDLMYAGQIQGFNLGLAFRDYFTPEKKLTFYLEPFIKYQFLRDFYNTRYYTLGTGLVLGGKWTIQDRVSLEYYLGPCVNLGYYKEGTQSAVRIPEWLGPINGIWGRFGFSVGYKFN